MAGCLVLIDQLLVNDRGRRHSQSKADEKAWEQSDSRPDAERHCDKRRCPHLQTAKAENRALGGKHARERKLQPDHEHEDRDPDLAEQAYALGRGKKIETIGPDQEPRSKIADDGREAESQHQRNRQE